MIQFTVSKSSDAVERLKEALEKGVTWIILPPDADDDLVDNAEKLCREQGVILTVTDNLELLERKRFHGILLSRSLDAIPLIRESLGGHPIIGVVLKPGDEFLRFKGWDIDYIALETEVETNPEISRYISEIKGNWNIPVVAVCDVGSAEDIDKLTEAGFDGVNTGDAKLK